VAVGFVSFFSGALGLDLGLERAGLVPLALAEKDRSAQATIRANRPDLPLFGCNVRSLSPASVALVTGWEPFAVVGGPPCQAFSTAGRRGSFSDQKGNVFLRFLDLAIGLRPCHIVVENVRGLLSAPLRHRPHSMRGDGHPALASDEMPGGALRHIVAVLEDAGYGVSFELYNVANFGVPQTRERLLLIASSEGRVAPHLAPTHEGKWRTFRDAVEGLGQVGDCATVRKGREEFLKHVGPGENWRALPVEMQRRALGRAYDSTGGRVGFCRRLAWDKPAPTLVTSPNMPATELVHPHEMRPLSVNEYKRLQTFPDEWQVEGTLAAKYRQIGNAVPVEFGYVIGRHLLSSDSWRAEASGPVARLSRYHATDHDSWRRKLA
jgi:DNA (cytosine-5)-methyltransferase 1